MRRAEYKLKRILPAFIIMTFYCVFCLGQNNNPSTVMIFLLGGQSNMDGCGLSEELPHQYKVHPENTVTWDNQRKSWMPLGKDSFAERRKQKFGPEIAFSHLLAKKFPDHTIAIVKTSGGGTKLWKHWLPEKPMYNRFLTNMNNALNELKDSGVTYEICGMLWMQGESDAENIAWANAYEKNLKVLFNDVRIQTEKEDLPMVMGRISSRLLRETPWNFDHTKIVQKAQENVAVQDENVFIINTDKLKTLKDNTHFNTKAQIWLGVKMAKKMMRYLKKNS